MFIADEIRYAWFEFVIEAYKQHGHKFSSSLNQAKYCWPHTH